ncbi:MULTISPECIES: HP0495 family protein [Snodgrassella]|uniref:UPF0250 protein BHC47_05795 n=1 Tax=Snodgrassella alvi TaxID=1196083 RepID=A0A1X0TBF1_9NEIS|nr:MULTISPECIES: DUF493 domain-containing protein [Snodgrassella]AHN27790.1 putative lipoate regulatory protein YbeD [Snodgrassella alvi wkB2]MBI0068007.1 DUF493 domain-containing protein [Snodgrassella sp. M0110]MBI0077006.1 DUF493 domain-containing protein [Snodgrassella sp. M0118]MBI0079307.1 DUF493 domain-containing protein [Snodgrassella sp. M0112]MBI0098397.1 DUF493 domain-containing protein [Snodgrassella sp. W8134]
MSDNLKTSIIEFPLDFPIKVMGAQHPEFEAKVLEVVQQHAPDTAAENINTRPSSKGNYISATVVVRAENQEQLDNIYRALSSHPMVKVVL